MRVTYTQALYKYKQDKYPYIRNCTCYYNYNHDYPSYEYLPEYSPEAYIPESFAPAVEQCRQVFYLPGIGS